MSTKSEVEQLFDRLAEFQGSSVQWNQLTHQAQDQFIGALNFMKQLATFGG